MSIPDSTEYTDRARQLAVRVAERADEIDEVPVAGVRRGDQNAFGRMGGQGAFHLPAGDAQRKAGKSAQERVDNRRVKNGVVHGKRVTERGMERWSG